MILNKNLIKDWLLLQMSKDKSRFLFPFIFKNKINEAKQFKFSYRIDPEDKNYPLTVFYRISPYPNNKSPIYQKNKFKLTKLCLDSFIKAFNKIRPKIFFLLDSCPEKYLQLIKDYKYPNIEIINLKNAGNLGSFYAQLELAKQLPDKNLIYFSEDDYYYLPNAGIKLIRALKFFDFITLYDHKDHYQKPFADKKVILEFKTGHHWRSHSSTCKTFGTRAKIIKKFFKLFKKYPFTLPMWRELNKKNYLVFGPIPSLATHMVNRLLAPGIDWPKSWRTK